MSFSTPQMIPCTIDSHAILCAEKTTNAARVPGNSHVNLKHCNSKALLYYAVYHGKTGAVEFLLSRGSDGHALDSLGKTCLHYAA